MNAGQRTVDWLRREQFRVDEQWCVTGQSGFTWWPAQHSQQVYVSGSEAGPDGEPAYFVRITTNLLTGVTLTDTAFAGISLLMSTASMAGPVYDARTGVLTLSSLVRIDEASRAWLSPLVNAAAMLQIADAHFVGPALPGLIGGQLPASGHPRSGPRSTPDAQVAEFVTHMSSAGTRPSAWHESEFAEVVEGAMHAPPALRGAVTGRGCRVEFPYGDSTSLCEIRADVSHSRIGSGLQVVQSFPVGEQSDTDGTRLALGLNAEELHQHPWGYGLGSYTFREGCLCFSGFIPSLAHRPGLLPHLYVACAARARVLALRFRSDDWSELTHRKTRARRTSTIGRLMSAFGH